MAPGRIQKAVGAVKDQTTISLAKVGTASRFQTEVEITIVKATRHDNRPADERHVREILNITRFSRQSITLCVTTISMRMSKTRNWIVALKALILIHRLLNDGDPAYEEEVFFATKRGTRLLNMSDFRDRASARTIGAWDFSAFVRTFARYLDERLEYKMHGRRRKNEKRVVVVMEKNDVPITSQMLTSGIGDSSSLSVNSNKTPVRDLDTNAILNRSQHLKLMMERFIACRPAGAARNNAIVAVALYPLVKESHQIYYDLSEIIAILVDRFMEIEISYCVKIIELFTALSKQFDELNSFYEWCKNVGISRISDYPVVEKITQKRLDMMNEFVHDRIALASKKSARYVDEEVKKVSSSTSVVEEKAEDSFPINGTKALPAPEQKTMRDAVAAVAEEDDKKEVDLLNLHDEPTAVTWQEHGDQLALALFDGNMTTTTSSTSSSTAGPTANANWKSLTHEKIDWETALVQSITTLPDQKPTFTGAFDTLTLDGMYRQKQQITPSDNIPTGRASSMVYLSNGNSNKSPTTFLALPQPPGTSTNNFDPFAASMTIAPPSYVQMADMEKKKMYLAEEHDMWKQYAADGFTGQVGLAKVEQQRQLYQPRFR